MCSQGEGEMSFTSLWYFPFLCAVAVLYRFLGGRFKPWFLLAVSWLMYAMFGIAHFLLLVCVTVISYWCGIEIERKREKKQFVLAAGIAVIVGILFYMKYFDMFLLGIQSAAGLTGRNITFAERHIVLPVGISFYTFQSLSYLIDVYRGQKREKNFVLYALYISFFPQLVAGPIEQAGALLPQLTGRNACRKELSEGIRYLLSGCVRKFAIADYMAVFVDEVYGNVAYQSGINLGIATLLFAVQIYCDFSGYTHIALGSARLLGIRLTENFNRPYLAQGCRDFWKRWHITLTKWFTEYVYIPLGGNRRGNLRKYANIMFVFVLSGLWHGADFTFVCWGAFFGIWRILEEAARDHEITLFGGENKNSRIKRLCMTLGTFLLVCVSWILFRSQSISEAAEVLRKMVMLEEGAPFMLKGMELLGVVMRVGILAVLPVILKPQAADEKGIVKVSYAAYVMTFLIIVCILFMFDSVGESSFIYFQF